MPRNALLIAGDRLKDNAPRMRGGALYVPLRGAQAVLHPVALLGAFGVVEAIQRAHQIEQFQFETLRVSNHTACRFAEKARFFRSLWAGRRCAAASRFHLFQR